ncbi:transposase [Streptomyces goshikiensis]
MPGPPSPLPSLPTRGGGNVSPRCYLNVPLGGTDPGHRPMDDRAALRAIVYVLCKSVSWRDVPAEQVGCSGVTTCRRLRDWMTEAGAWPRLYEVFMAGGTAGGRVTWTWTWTTRRSTLRTSGPSKGADTGPSPVGHATRAVSPTSSSTATAPHSSSP